VQDKIKKLSYKYYIDNPSIQISEEYINDESKLLMKDFFKNQITFRIKVTRNHSAIIIRRGSLSRERAKFLG
jgi:hypothetical protein